MPDADIARFEPDDLAYEAFIDDCMRDGIDPTTGAAIEWLSPEWTLDESDIPFTNVVISYADEDIPF